MTKQALRPGKNISLNIKPSKTGGKKVQLNLKPRAPQFQPKNTIGGNKYAKSRTKKNYA